MIAPHRILLTAVGTQTSYNAVAALRGLLEQTGAPHFIVGADTNPRHLLAASPQIDAFEMAPAAADPAFVEWLKRTVARHRIDTYFPVIDSEIAIAANLRESGALPGVCVVAPSASSAAIAYDKWDAFKLFSTAHIATPACWINPALIDTALDRVLVKPRAGFGSRGVRISSPQNLMLSNDEMAQQLCIAPEITVDAFHDSRTGLVRVLARERLEVKAGVSTKARIHESAELHALTRQLLSVWPYEGSFCYQVMRDAVGGQWQIIDLNSRPGAGTAMSAALDNHFFAAHFLRAWNADAAQCFTPLVGDRYVIRRYLDVVTA